MAGVRDSTDLLVIDTTQYVDMSIDICIRSRRALFYYMSVAKEHAALVRAKYEGEKWYVHQCGRSHVCDFLVFHGKTAHFVKIVKDREEVPAQVQHDFVQNAFSNGATPVFARISQILVKESAKGNDAKVGSSAFVVRFVNADKNTAAVIARLPKK